MLTINREGKWALYWGAMPLPSGSEPLGTVTRNETDTGALIKLRSGEYVQGNGGAIRRLPQREVR
jgi:hypothetical protein